MGFESCDKKYTQEIPQVGSTHWMKSTVFQQRKFRCGVQTNRVSYRCEGLSFIEIESAPGQTKTHRQWKPEIIWFENGAFLNQLPTHHFPYWNCHLGVIPRILFFNILQLIITNIVWIVTQDSPTIRKDNANATIYQVISTIWHHKIPPNPFTSLLKMKHHKTSWNIMKHLDT